STPITSTTTTDSIIGEPVLYTYTEVTQENVQIPTQPKPVKTAVLGEKEENTEIANEPIIEENIENSETEEVNNETIQNPQTKKYIFITSLIVFISLIGYMVFKRKS
ncbi:MAG: hypothetical protein KBD29_03080, partial [Candidatus Magasanikbacteria bacterium]|nr:hypothetical protein [Candidatus Magasanikbacteria bacterium]